MAASKLDQARARASRLREKFRQGEPVRGVSALGAGALVGSLERAGIVPITVASFPVKPLLAIGAYAIGASSSQGGTMASVGLGAGAGIMGAYGYAVGKAGTVIAGDIAGDDEDEYTEDVAEDVAEEVEVED